MSTSRSPFDRSPLGTVGSIVVALLFFFVLFKLLGFVFKLIWWAAPVLFIASLVIDHKVFLGYLKTVGDLFRRNWIFGLALGIASLVLFPLLSVYLLGMALFKKKMKEKRAELDERVNGKWTEYEEVPTAPGDIDIPYQELPPIREPQPQPRTRKDDTKYDELFD